MKRIMTIYGTRPEAIKLAPVIRALEESEHFQSLPVVTGQHKEMLHQVNDLFGISPVGDLAIMTQDQTLNQIVAKVITGIDEQLAVHEPHAVIIQGDTSTVMGAAIASFNRGIPVFHVEAGLRSGNIDSPFPEEANRKLTTQVARIHLAPTHQAKSNLLAEGVSEADVVVTGNTVIDALMAAVENPAPFSDPRLEEFASSAKPLVLVTTHRRENLGHNMVQIGQAISRLADEHPDRCFVLPLHKNPKVREAVMPQIEGLDNVLCVEPLDYAEFTHLISVAEFVLTDSGGVQEEAPSLGKPVLVLRENTERPEAVESGSVRLIGTSFDSIVEESNQLIRDPEHARSMANAVNPYGDGQAAARSIAALEEYFGLGPRMADFSADSTQRNTQ